MPAASIHELLQSVLDGVCSRYGYVYGEALLPTHDPTRLHHSITANYSQTHGARDFARSSSNFCFPLNVCIPGRVWYTRTAEWHNDVSLLTSSVFLRVGIAGIVGLQGGVCIPLISQEAAPKVIAVILLLSNSPTPFFTGCIDEVMAFANTFLEGSEVEASFRSNPSHTLETGFGGGVGAPGGGGGWGGYGGDAEEGKCWLVAKQMLSIPPNERDKEAIGTILKFSKRLPLFKYITNTQRTALCSSMEHMALHRGAITHRIEDPEDGKWSVVVSGSVTLMARTCPGGEFVRMCKFGPGETFGHSYLRLFTRAQEDAGVYIECEEEGTECVRVTIPGQFRRDFRTLSRPVWYGELSTCFHYSVDQAADRLGICMSVIKKICRRHGITRWPHRKLQSANKNLAVLEGKISTTADPAARDTLISEAVNVLTSKLRLTANPAYVVGLAGEADQGASSGKAGMGAEGSDGKEEEEEEEEEERRSTATKRRRVSVKGGAASKASGVGTRDTPPPRSPATFPAPSPGRVAREGKAKKKRRKEDAGPIESAPASPKRHNVANAFRGGARVTSARAGASSKRKRGGAGARRRGDAHNMAAYPLGTDSIQGGAEPASAYPHLHVEEWEQWGMADSMDSSVYAYSDVSSPLSDAVEMDSGREFLFIKTEEESMKQFEGIYNPREQGDAGYHYIGATSPLLRQTAADICMHPGTHGPEAGLTPGVHGMHPSFMSPPRYPFSSKVEPCTIEAFFSLEEAKVGCTAYPC